MANLKDIWTAGNDSDAAARIGGEKRPFRDYLPPSDYDPRQRRRTEEPGFAAPKVRASLQAVSCNLRIFPCRN